MNDMKGKKFVRISRPEGSSEESRALDEEEADIQARLEGSAPAQEPSAGVVQARESLGDYKTLGKLPKSRDIKERRREALEYFAKVYSR